ASTVSGEEIIGRVSAIDGRGRRENAGAGPRRFLAQVALIEYLDADAGATQEIRGGQTNDAAAKDQNLRMLCHAGVIAQAHAADMPGNCITRVLGHGLLTVPRRRPQVSSSSGGRPSVMAGGPVRRPCPNVVARAADMPGKCITVRMID